MRWIAIANLDALHAAAQQKVGDADPPPSPFGKYDMGPVMAPIATRQRAKTFELGAATSLARLWRDQGKRTEAHDLLAPIYGWFTEGFDTPVLQDAKALLDELA
jgi:hypothetical protein